MRGSAERSETAAPAVLPPRANPDLVGHDAAERALRRLYDLDRLPHAILLHGPRGIGKATLAFRFARFVLAGAAERTAPTPRGSAARGPRMEAGLSTGSGGLAIDPDSGVFRRVAAGGHADLLTVERAWDPQRRRLRGEILVEDVREIAAFLRLTPAEEGWRIVVVDGAEEMNASAANALLKILEEPPQRALLLVVSHNPGRLLPTIRSRCRRLPLAALPSALVRQLLAHHRPGLAVDDTDSVAALSQGSIGRALELADAGGIGLYRALLAILSSLGSPRDEARGAGLPAIDVPGLHAFADRLARPEAEDGYRTATELLTQFLARLAAGAARRLPASGGAEIAAGEGAIMRRLASGAAPAHWAQLVDELGRRFARTDGLNLDKKEALLGAVFAIARLAG